MSERLLLFYAIECGLKALILRNRNVDDTSKLPPAYQIRHDLREGLKLMSAPRTLTIRAVKTRQKTMQHLAPRDLHEAYRYGVTLVPEEVIDDLVAIREWIKGRI